MDPDGGGGGGATSPCGDASPAGPADAGCNIACGLVPCPVRCIEPRVLVTRPLDEEISALAVSADTLYFGTYPSQTPGAIYAMPLSGGAPTLLVENVLVRELRLGGDILYYIHKERVPGLGGASLQAIPIMGGISKEINRGVDLSDITPVGSGIYFVWYGSGIPSGIVHVSGDGTGSAVEGVSGFVRGIAVDNDNIYWGIESRGYSLVQRSLLDGSTTTLTTSTIPISKPISDGVDVHFVEGRSAPDDCASAVMSVPKSVGAPTTRLSPGTSGADVMALARDDTHIYWSSTGAHGAVLRAQKGQTPEIIAADQQGASPPVLGANDVYWIAREASTYEVRTVPK